MAKAQKRKAEEPVTISKIYEAIKARDFIQDLWCDLVADIQEKPTYKRIKDLVTALVNNEIEEFSDDPLYEAERLKRRTKLTEISIMTYTVDTIISELLSKKMMNEFQYIVENIVREIKPDIAPSHRDAAGPSNFNGNRTEPTSLSSNISTAVASSRDKIIVPKKRGRPRKEKSDYSSKSDSPKSDSLKETPTTPKKRGRPRKNPLPEGSNNCSSPAKSISKSPKALPLNNDIKDQHKEDNESDVESIFSDGALSLTSVSSVHTSELSSFEDTISIDGDEEGEKKQIPLKVANELYMKGALSQICGIGKKAKKQNKTKKIFSADENSQSSLSDSSSRSQKILPQRIRKPNSKYSSDTMICETYQSVAFSPLRKEKTVPQSKPSPKKLCTDKAVVSRVNSSPEKISTTVSPSRKSALKSKKQT